MKNWCIILLLFTEVLATAQSPEEIRRSINRIKTDVEHYLYGSGMEENHNRSEDAAFAELSTEVMAYCQLRKFSYIHSIGNIQKDSVHFITYAKTPSYYTSIAYLPKSVLDNAEAEKISIIESEERVTRIKAFLDELKTLDSIGNVRDLLQQGQGANISTRYGESFDPESIKYIAGSFLIFYEKRSGAILEIMTPETDNRKRINLITSTITDTRKYKTAPIIWVYIEGFNWDL